MYTQNGQIQVLHTVDNLRLNRTPGLRFIIVNIRRHEVLMALPKAISFRLVQLRGRQGWARAITFKTYFDTKQRWMFEDRENTELIRKGSNY